MKFKLTFTQVLIFALLVILVLVLIAYTHNGVIDLRGPMKP
jgi:hypothetical protein